MKNTFAIYMDKRLRKQAAFYVITSIVDANNGKIIVDSKKIKSIFNCQEHIVKVEYADGNIGLAYDIDIDILESIIFEWKKGHSYEFEKKLIMKNKKSRS